MSHAEHTALSRDAAVRCAVVTVSDTRTEATDSSGNVIRDGLLEDGHDVSAYRLVPDEPDVIGSTIDALTSGVEVILLSGGTGISRRDTTIEAVTARFEKEIPGFGELFRMLSFDEIGAGAMLSRASAGVYRDTLLFSMPGSTNAVRLAMTRLILPELRHLVWEIIRQKD